MSKTVKTAPVKPTPVTTDTGRVHVGGGMIRYAGTTSADASTQDTGRVHVGGGMMRFAAASPKAAPKTQDAGRVHVGGGMMRF